MKINIFLEKELENKEGCIGLEDLSYDNTPIDFNSFEQEQNLSEEEVLNTEKIYNKESTQLIGTIQSGIKDTSCSVVSVEKLELNHELFRPSNLKINLFVWKIVGDKDEY